MDFLAIEQPLASKKAFVPVAVMLFFLSLFAADSIGFVPYYVDGSSPRTAGGSPSLSGNSVNLSDLPQLGEEQQVAQPTQQERGELYPERIVISSIDLDLPVQNPETRDIEKLYEVLRDGPARYVDSALLGQKGNMLIFAHSSRLPVVRNQMYKAFNDIYKLAPGDIVTIVGGGKEYLYSVVNVRRANAEEELIDLSPSGDRLTLVTCDTLTSKSSRWIVEAELVGKY